MRNAPRPLTDRRDIAKLNGPVEATAFAPSKANAPDKVTNELNATQRSLNSRRLSDRVPLLFITLFLRLRARSEDLQAEFRSASSAPTLKPPAASPDMAEFCLCAGFLDAGKKERSASSIDRRPKDANALHSRQHDEKVQLYPSRHPGA